MVPKVMPMRANSSVVDALCESKQLGNRELARRMGKSSQFVMRLRRGERTASLSTIKIMADVLEVPLESLLLPHEKPRADAK